MTTWLTHESDYFIELGTLTSDQEDTLDLLCIAAQAAIEKYLNRIIAAANYDEVVEAQNDGRGFLKQYPVNYLTRFYNDRVAGLTLQHTSAQIASYYVDRAGSTLRLNSVTSGVETAQTTTLTGVTLSALATAVNALAGDWLATAATDYAAYPATDLAEGYGDATSEATVELWKGSGRTIPTINRIGEIAIGCRYARVRYNAGYSAIPEDLLSVCADMAKAMFSGGGQVVSSESLGDYSYTVAAMTDTLLRLPLQNKNILAKYKERYV